MGNSRTVQWRRDASNSRTVRVLWALGTGTFLAAIVLIVAARLFLLLGQTESVVVATLVAVAIVAVAAVSRTTGRLEFLRRRLPFSNAGGGLDRVRDSTIGAIVMAVVILVLARGVGGGLGHGLAALTIPFAFVAIVLATALESVGELDCEQRRLRLYDPEEVVDLELVDDVSVRSVGDTALLTLEYAQPDGTYVPGPRRLVVPAAVARELQALVAER
ncbi:hypothetical protein ACFOZ7_22505 [Natribaculum luteum]|uniref:DUF5673 domain-containing protein n=1 Tax=Natribaculum luteum TaxID=1586232 RepID=A0ABD5P5V5_9EURY|nr:hypothetical protein [Natribaculum luteum]